MIANNTLVDNDHGIEIGYDNQGKYTKPPRDVYMAYNLVTSDRGTLVTYINAPGDISWIDNLIHTSGTAILNDGLSFTDGEIIEADPLLDKSGAYNGIR